MGAQEVRLAIKNADENANNGKLKPKRETFVENYLSNGGNGQKAAEDAGFAPGASARVEASRLLTIPNIQAKIQARIAESRVAADEIVGNPGRPHEGRHRGLLP
jgi:hypothetical protein